MISMGNNGSFLGNLACLFFSDSMFPLAQVGELFDKVIPSCRIDQLSTPNGNKSVILSISSPHLSPPLAKCQTPKFGSSGRVPIQPTHADPKKKHSPGQGDRLSEREIGRIRCSFDPGWVGSSTDQMQQHNNPGGEQQVDGTQGEWKNSEKEEMIALRRVSGIGP